MRAVAVAVAVAAMGIWAAPAPAAEAAPAPYRPVTLITGDRLLISPDGRAASRIPTPGRDDVALVSEVVDGHLQVVPADAVPLVQAGKLDPRLFDITEVLATGRADVPLIITYPGESATSAVRAAAGGAAATDLPTIQGTAVRVDAARTADMWSSLTTGTLRSAYRKVWLDAALRPSIDVSVPLVGAPAAWAAGYTGGGVPVGVLDTGIDADHPDLAGAVSETADFTGGDGVDRAGHGTLVASIIAGSGSASAGLYRGMAPDVQIYSAKVCESQVCPESSVLAGMLWAARDKSLKVVNLSLGHTDRPGIDLIEEAVDKLTREYGTLFVVASGNGSGRVSSPASADAALAVAATTMDDTVAEFSSPGPRVGDGGLKPDIAAPGVDIVAAPVGDSSLPRTGPGGAYTSQSGTSMAAPHVAGAAAMLAQQHPDWTPAHLKAALTGAATALAAAGADRVGAGRLDVAKAVASPVLADPASLSFGDRFGVRPVTYHNSSDTAVALDLSLASDAPGGAFTLDQPRITVPARGSASVHIIADPRVVGPDGRFSGALTAAGGDAQIRTMLGMRKAPETFALTVRYTDRTGAPADRTYGAAYGLGGTGRSALPNADGTGTLRLPKAYTLDTKVFGDDGEVTLLNQPKLVLDKDTTVEMDARLGKPVTVPAPRAGATQVYANVAFALPGAAGSTLQDATFDDMYTAQIGPDAGLSGFRTDVAASWAQGSSRNSPYVYSLAWTVKDRFVTGFVRAIDPSSLTAVDTEYGAAAAGTTGLMNRSLRGSGYTSAFDLPFHRIEYFTTGPGVRWAAQFVEIGAPGSYVSLSGGAPALPDIERWNKPVFGPAFTRSNEASRTGDQMTVDPSWFSDGTGEHGGSSIDATHRTVVTRDGAILSDTTSQAVSLTVPAGAAVYTITNENSRQSLYSTSNRTKWTFCSSSATGKTPLPLAVIRFQPRPGDVLSFTVRHPAGGSTTRLGLQVSYDDGMTWRKTLLTRIGDHGIAVLRPPAGEGFVSLKASAADVAGNTVEQTIVRAYGY